MILLEKLKKEELRSLAKRVNSLRIKFQKEVYRFTSNEDSNLVYYLDTSMYKTARELEVEVESALISALLNDFTLEIAISTFLVATPHMKKQKNF